MKQQELAAKWERRIHAFNYRGSVQDFPWVYSVAEFRAILERECASVNRNCHTFSLVVFDIHDPDVDNTTGLRLVYTLKTRIRSTDVMGMVEHGKLGLALPYCDIEGAHRVVENAFSMLYRVKNLPRYEIFSYPTHWCYEEAESQETLHSETSRADESLQTLGPHLDNPMPLWKRTLDVIGAIAALIIFTPIMALTALIIKILSPGPVLFKQQRIGYMGRPFTFYKFRTMHVNADEQQHADYTTALIRNDNNGSNSEAMEKMDDDNRMIPWGNAIRKACLDEFPQLFNVLCGDMSLVGPRPCLPYEAREYFLWNTERFNTIPGMTGLWQVNGKNKLTFKQMVRLDITYARNKSLCLDLSILLNTIPTICTQISEYLSRKYKQNTNNVSGANECLK